MQNKLFKAGVALLLLFAIIYVGSLIQWVFTPILVITQTLFVPLVLTVFLFYLLRPLVHLLEKNMKKTYAILVIYVGGVVIIGSLLAYFIPTLINQFVSLTDNLPAIFERIQEIFESFENNDFIANLQFQGLFDLEELLAQLNNSLDDIFKGIATNITGFVSTVANVVLIIFIIPFILFYVLRDYSKMVSAVVDFFKKDKQEEVKQVLKQIDATLSSYIQGQGLVCLVVGTLELIAYLIIGLDYALLLAVIAGSTNIIPYFGPWIGAIPAVIVALFISPFKALLVIVSIVVIQQLEGTFVSPQIIGKKMKIHPLTVMLLILLVGRLAGVLGMIIAVPVYAVVKVVLAHIWPIFVRKFKEST